MHMARRPWSSSRTHTSAVRPQKPMTHWASRCSADSAAGWLEHRDKYNHTKLNRSNNAQFQMSEVGSNENKSGIYFSIEQRVIPEQGIHKQLRKRQVIELHEKGMKNIKLEKVSSMQCPKRLHEKVYKFSIPNRRVENDRWKKRHSSVCTNSDFRQKGQK